MATVAVSVSQNALVYGALALGVLGFVLAFFGLISAEDKCEISCDDVYRLSQFSAWWQLFVYLGIACAVFYGRTAQYTVIILTFLAICSTLCILSADKGITEADNAENGDRETAASCYASGFVFCAMADFFMIVILGLQVQNLEGAVKASNTNPMFEGQAATPPEN